MNLDDAEPLPAPADCALADRWILTRFQTATREITAHLEEYDLGLAAQKIYDFAWNEFCDWYIELVKSRLSGENDKEKRAARGVLLHVLTGLLKLLHPIMPFLTDAVYRNLPGAQSTIMLTEWPNPDPAYDFPADATRLDGILDAIRAVRNMRAEMKVPVGKRAQLMALPKDGWEQTLSDAAPLFQRMAWVSELTIIATVPASDKMVSAVCPAAELYIPLGDLVDLEKEAARLAKECENLRQEIARAEGKLNNPGFTDKAPAHLVAAERAKLEANCAMLATLEERALVLSGLA